MAANNSMVSQSDVIAAANVLMVAVMKATRMIVSKFSQLPAMRQVPGVDGITVGLTNAQRAQRRADPAQQAPMAAADAAAAAAGGSAAPAPGAPQQQARPALPSAAAAGGHGTAGLQEYVRQTQDRQRIIETNEMVGVFYALAIWYTVIVVIVLTVYGMNNGDSIVFCFSLLATALVSEVDILSRHLGSANADPLGRHL
jgi:hypothetical protein